MNNQTGFENLGLSQTVLDAVIKKGFEEPTEIQQLAIPALLSTADNIIARAQTGTGKTAAFGLPALDRIVPEKKNIQTLVLTPTRELAIQVAEEIHSLSGKIDIRVLPVYGGQSIALQLRALKKGPQIIIGTPGRIIDHLGRGSMKIDKLNFLVLDEADEMLNMGFIDDIEKIMSHANPDRRTILFSATVPDRIRDLASRFMKDHIYLSTKTQQAPPELTNQVYYEVRENDKFEALIRIIDSEPEFYGLVFCRTKNDVDQVQAHLNTRGYDSGSIHGDITQNQREKILRNFRTKKINILVATDVAARGIDVQDITHVINYALPHDPESYIHRIGRTGRAGKTGTAITFITPGERRRLMFIQRKAKTDIEKSNVPKIKDIIKIKRKRIYDDLSAIIEKGVDPAFSKWASKFTEEHSAEDVLAALFSYCFKTDIDPATYPEIAEVKDKKPSPVDPTAARLYITVGRKDKMTKRKLVDMIVRKSKIKQFLIDDVQVLDSYSFITVPMELADTVIQSFDNRGKRPFIMHAKKDDKLKKRGRRNKKKKH